MIINDYLRGGPDCPKTLEEAVTFCKHYIPTAAEPAVDNDTAKHHGRSHLLAAGGVYHWHQSMLLMWQSRLSRERLQKSKKRRQGHHFSTRRRSMESIKNKQADGASSTATNNKYREQDDSSSEPGPRLHQHRRRGRRSFSAVTTFIRAICTI